MGSIVADGRVSDQIETWPMSVTQNHLGSASKSPRCSAYPSALSPGSLDAQPAHNAEAEGTRRRSRRTIVKQALLKILVRWNPKARSIRPQKGKSSTTNVPSSTSHNEQPEQSCTPFTYSVLLEVQSGCILSSFDEQAMVDTGCPDNLINPDVVRQHNIKYHRFPHPFSILTTLDGRPVNFIGYTRFRWAFRHPENIGAPAAFITSTFFIPEQPTNFRLLIGQETLSKHKIVSIHPPVDHLRRRYSYPLFRAKLPRPETGATLQAAENAQRARRNAEALLERQAQTPFLSASGSGSVGHAATVTQQSPPHSTTAPNSSNNATPFMHQARPSLVPTWSPLNNAAHRMQHSSPSSITASSSFNSAATSMQQSPSRPTPASGPFNNASTHTQQNPSRSAPTSSSLSYMASHTEQTNQNSFMHQPSQPR